MIARGERPRLDRRARLRFDRVEGRWLLVYPERALALNETAVAIVRLLTGEHRVDGIVDRLAADAAPAARDAVERDVLSFLGRLAERRLLERVP